MVVSRTLAPCRKAWLAISLSALAAWAALIGPAAAASGEGARTRFIIGLEKPVQFQVFSLSNPNRVIVELPEGRMQLPAPADSSATGLVKAFRGGLSAPGKARVVIDVTTPVVVEKAAIEKGKDGKSPRLVLDIVPVEAGAKPHVRRPLKTAAFALGAAGVQPPLPKPAERPDVKAAKAFKPIVVIDPGHGGHDSGAQKHGTIEKDVVLAFSKVLRDRLHSTGRYKVVMTRDTDVFIDLDERLEIAERANAHLFIAVHADYAGGSARGATIYSLGQQMAESLKRSAKGEVTQKVLSGKEVQSVKAESSTDIDVVRDILSDLAQREVDVTKDRTSVFTRSVIEYMGQSTNLMGNPDRSANFRVLKTAKFPSVLIELAYVSNKQDAQLLKSNEWRKKVSESIAIAVDNYFGNQLARLPM